MTVNRAHKYRLKPLSVLSHYVCFSFLVSMGKLSLTSPLFLFSSVSAFVKSDIISNYFTCMCIYIHKYLQVKEIGNVVKIISLTVFHILKHL